MRKTFLIISIPAFSSLFAQVELLSSDMPSFGTVLTYEWCNFNFNDTTLQGSDVTWDFSAMDTGVEVMTFTFMDPANTPEAASYTSTNYARVLNTGAVTQYYYYDKTAPHLDLEGVWVSSPGSYGLNMRQLVFPMTLGTQYSTYANYTSTSIAGVGTGTLLLPSGSFSNVLLVRRITVYDEILYYNFYEWYSTENGALLLSVMTSNDGLVPYDFFVITGISTSLGEDIAGSNQLRCVAPVVDELELVYDSETSGSADLVITNNVGQVVRNISISIVPGQKRSTLFVGDLATGCYMLILRPKDAINVARTIRFVKQ